MNPISLDEIEQARERIAESTLRSPLVRLGVDDALADIHLKLENLQPTGSFKARGAGNAIALLSDRERERGGVYLQRGKHGSGSRMACASEPNPVYRDRA